MNRPRLYILALLSVGLTTCSKLDDPFAGVKATDVFDLQATLPSGAKATEAETTLLADGHSVLAYTITLKDDAALFSQLAVTAASDDLMLSLTGSATGAMNTLSIPFAGRQSVFYAIAPRNFQADARLTVSSGNVRQVAIIKLKEAAPNWLNVTPAVLRATVGTPFTFVTTLSDNSLTPRAVSGQLPVTFTASPATATTTNPLIPYGRSVAQTDGTATVSTTITFYTAGTFRYQANVLGVQSAPFTIECQ